MYVGDERMKRKTWIRATWLLLLLGLLVFPGYAADMPEDAPPAESEAMFGEEIENNAVQTAPQKQTTILEGKSILCIGDSLMAGYGLEDPQGQSWVSMLGSCYGMRVTCRAISGSTIASADRTGYMPGGCYKPMVERELPDGNFDLILVDGGGNDWYCTIPLGDSLTERNPKTFQGAINVLIDRLQEKYPKSAISFMTPWIPYYENPVGHTPEGDYYEAMSQVCAARGIPCYQARDPEVSGIYANDSDFRKQYCISANDPWHLNPEGQALFLPHIAQWLEEQTRQNVLVAGFRDVKRQAWYADTVKYMAERKLMMGTETDEFSPEQPTTRGMLVAVLYRAAGYPDVTGVEIPFEDVSQQKYYYDAVRWAYQQGAIYGTDETHFEPEGNLTREQMASILYRLWIGEHPNAEESAGAENLNAFSDQNQLAGYARLAMSWAVRNGIVYGTGGGRLEPKASAERAQVAAMLQRYWENTSLH